MSERERWISRGCIQTRKIHFSHTKKAAFSLSLQKCIDNQLTDEFQSKLKSQLLWICCYRRLQSYTWCNFPNRKVALLERWGRKKIRKGAGGQTELCTKLGPCGAHWKSSKEDSFELWMEKCEIVTKGNVLFWETATLEISIARESALQKLRSKRSLCHMFVLNTEAKNDPAPVPSFHKYCCQTKIQMKENSKKSSHNWKWYGLVRLSTPDLTLAAKIWEEDVCRRRHWLWPSCKWFAGETKTAKKRCGGREAKDKTICILPTLKRGVMPRFVQCHGTKYSSTYCADYTLHFPTFMRQVPDCVI